MCLMLQQPVAADDFFSLYQSASTSPEQSAEIFEKLAIVDINEIFTEYQT